MRSSTLLMLLTLSGCASPSAAGRPPPIDAGEEARTVTAEGLYLHDDHYHLTHSFQDEDWQALYRDRADGSPLPPIRRQIAATILAQLLDQRIPGASPEATEQGLRRLRSVIAKVRRAVEGDAPARAIEAIVTHDFEIRDEGRSLEVAGQRFRAQPPVRFAYCGDHVHVEDEGGKWAQAVELEGQVPGAFAWPGSIFFEVGADGAVTERKSSSRWRELSDGGQIHFSRDHWHVTERYGNPGLRFILATMDDAQAAPPVREKARALAFELLRLRLDTGSDAELEVGLRAIDATIDRAAEALAKELPAPRKGPSG